nr:hypothetical protein [Tanacetum cinerariifolium]
LPRRKRSGQAVAWSTGNSLAFDATKSTSTATSLYNNLTFLPDVAEELKNRPDAVTQKLQKLRELRKSFNM